MESLSRERCQWRLQDLLTGEGRLGVAIYKVRGPVVGLLAFMIPYYNKSIVWGSAGGHVLNTGHQPLLTLSCEAASTLCIYAWMQPRILTYLQLTLSHDLPLLP